MQQPVVRGTDVTLQLRTRMTLFLGHSTDFHVTAILRGVSGGDVLCTRFCHADLGRNTKARLIPLTNSPVVVIEIVFDGGTIEFVLFMRYSLHFVHPAVAYKITEP